MNDIKTITDSDFITTMLDMVAELDRVKGNGEDQIFYMSEFDDIYNGITPSEIATKITFSSRYGWEGHIFNTGDEYFSYQGDGNLISIPENLMRQYLCEIITDDFSQEECEEYLTAHFDIPTAKDLLAALPFGK